MSVRVDEIPTTSPKIRFLAAFAGMTSDAKLLRELRPRAGEYRGCRHQREPYKRHRLGRTTGPGLPRPGTRAGQLENEQAFRPPSGPNNNLHPTSYRRTGAQ